MAVSSTIKATKFQIKYTDKNGTYTFSNLKNSGITDDNILATAQAFISVQKYGAEKIYKIVDSQLTNV